MYIVVECGLSSIVEYGATIYVVGFCKIFCLSELLCQALIYFKVSIYLQKKPQALTI
jgi:hypothetical protein